MAQSTHPDVERLLDAFAGVRRNGETLFHQAVEEVLGLPRTAPRYRVIVHRWRARMLTEHHILLDGMAARGHGWVVRTAWQMVTYGVQALAHVERTLTKTTTVLQRVSAVELEPWQRTTQEHLLKYTSSLLAHLAVGRSAIPTPALRPTGAAARA